MSATVQQLLDTFDALPDAQKHQAGIEILRRFTGDAAADMPENDLVAMADELFGTLDNEEAGHAPR